MAKTNFKELFENNGSIVIPKIQRDYAQGRQNNDVRRVRSGFINALSQALKTDSELTLDFIYGTTEEGQSAGFIPLDGQQRLTTLMLLTWLVSRRENRVDEAAFLSRFTYETRFTSRRFLEFLNRFVPTFGYESLSAEMRNHPEYRLDWDNDPTVSGMLVMLDNLDSEFYPSEQVYWDRLDNIVFYKETIEDLGLSDEIYIKMNSRGKPLTDFEHFKAAFDEETGSIFAVKTDTAWTDLMWSLSRHSNGDNGEVASIDSGFLNYFRYVASMICISENLTVVPADEFEMIKVVFDTPGHREILEKAFDCWIEYKQDGKYAVCDTDEFFSQWIAADYSPEEDRLVSFDSSNYANPLRIICEGNTQARVRLLLWFFILYRLNSDPITPDRFRRRLRVARNLLMNSDDELRAGREPAIMACLKDILINGTLADSADNSFNTSQLAEERRKLDWLKTNAAKESELARLENAPLVMGSTGAFADLDELLSLSGEFIKEFNPAGKTDDQWLALGRAVLSCGDDSRCERNWGRYLIPGQSRARESWRRLLYPSQDNAESERIGKVIIDFLRHIHNGKTVDDIIAGQTNGTGGGFDWRYYIVKYPGAMRNSGYGKYYWPDRNDDDIHFYSMYTSVSLSGRHWEVILHSIMESMDWDERLSLYEYGSDIEITGTTLNIRNTRDAIEIYDSELEGDAAVKDRFVVKKTDSGKDEFDRVARYVTHLRQFIDNLK